MGEAKDRRRSLCEEKFKKKINTMLGEILIDDEVVADKPSGASGKGGAPPPVIDNEPTDVAKTKAKCDKTLHLLYSGKQKVNHMLSCATNMGGSQGLCGREPGRRHGYHRGLLSPVWGR